MPTISSLGVGSGMDLNGLLDDLRAGEQQRLEPITQQKQKASTELSGLGKLKSALVNFQDKVKALGNAQSFQPVSSHVIGDGVSAQVTGRTPTGDYRISVTQLASASSAVGAGVESQSTHLGDGIITFTMKDGSEMTVAIDTNSSSLEDIRDAINTQNGPVRASIINDGSDEPFRLVLESTETGTKTAIEDINVQGDLAAQLSLGAISEAQDAQLSVNGIDIVSQSNRVEDAIQGVTLNLTAAGDTTLQVSRDTDAVKDAVKDLVSAFNSLQSTIGELTQFDAESGSAGPLLGNRTVLSIQSSLRSAMSNVVPGGDLRLLSDAGIELQLDGSLKINDEKLDEAVATNLDALTQFFTGGEDTDGFVAGIDAVINRFTGTNGSLKLAEDGLNSRIDSLNDRFNSMQQRIDQQMERYRLQFNQLDSMLAQMNSMSSYLAQQFNALSQVNG